MIWTLEPWLFYLLFSIIILVIAFVIGTGLHALLKKRGTQNKKSESILALGLAVVMASFYMFTVEMFTDQAAEGERIITTNGEKQVESAKMIVIPFGNYAVVERLYDFGYTVEDEIDGKSYRFTFVIEKGPEFLETYPDYIEGNGMFVNHSRISFIDVYEKEWKKKLQKASSIENVELPGVNVEVERES
ncbi:hypothetical protein D7Z54_21950 [Salibacterium salarium]|uniref:Uncharacterized protein n=1 Tax=Salibacterium salarium TaxID=284579 RepID=A0A428MYD9_9BACI|nr:hypothetical protein [Salibacterium salarium]RSL31174.1 hypothetical protein D7Z54_21950 [Salibacterium salarium]